MQSAPLPCGLGHRISTNPRAHERPLATWAPRTPRSTDSNSASTASLLISSSGRWASRSLTHRLAVYRLCLEARPHIKVALSGDGGDEIFFGYTSMRKQQWARRCRVVPRQLRQALHAASHGWTGTARPTGA